MAPRTQTRFLLVESDSSLLQTMAVALDAAGLAVEGVNASPRAFEAALKGEHAPIVVLRAEPGSDALANALQSIERARGGAGLPVVLLAADTRDEALLRQMTSGVVEVLKLPFNPKLHTARLRLLPMELPERSGELRGRGNGAQLKATLEHLARMKRTGLLQVNEGLADEGRAFFARGVLRDAWFINSRGNAALEALVRQPQASWAFAEGSATGASSIIELDGFDEAPLAMPGAPPPPAPAAAPEEELRFGSPSPPRASAAPAPDEAPPFEELRLDDLVPPAPAAQPAAAPSTARAPPPPATNVPRPAAPPAPAEPEPPSDAATTPILFVDDDAALLQMFGTYFSKKGYPVTLAADGVEAMQKLLAHPIDAIIADLNMPRLDGWGLLKAVRDDYRTSELPMALFSCHDDYRESLRALHAGASAYYSKALRMNALEVQLRELLEPRRRFKRLLVQNVSVVLPLSALGPQWVLRTLAQARFMGQLDARDGWSTWRFHFVSGALVHAASTVGPQGDGAVMGFLTSRGAEGSLAPGLLDVAAQFGGASTEVTLQRLVAALNEEQRRIRDEAMKEAKGLDVDPSLYVLYQQIGPPAWRPHVQLLCEQQLPPREVMQRTGVAPQELQGLIRDLIRRGVVSLRK